MKMMICEIGILDKQGIIHRVVLQEGFNIITGKSSTGKSSLIEIVDYCFASSHNTIGKGGFIEKSAERYYICLKWCNGYLILSRNSTNSNECYFSQEKIYDKDKINFLYLNSMNSMHIKYYKQQLNNFFIGIQDVDESEISKDLKGKKSAIPTVRSLMSFIFQHQSFIANKGQIFYRFDNKDKKDMVIEHVKIFLGFVDQNYFINFQNLQALKSIKRYLEYSKKYQEKICEEGKKDIQLKLGLLKAIMGSINNDKIPTFDLYQTPIDEFKNKINHVVNSDYIDPNSDDLTSYYIDLEKQLKEKINQQYSLNLKLKSIQHSISLQKQLSDRIIDNEIYRNTVEISKCICPFCQNETDELTQQAILLSEAINKISDSLISNKSLNSELIVAENLVKKDMKNINESIKAIRDELISIKNNNQVKEHKSLYEQALIAKVDLFSILDKINPSHIFELENKINETIVEIEKLDSKNIEYDIKNKVLQANKRVNEIMQEIGQKFNFEKHYLPINLKFSFETFDLYHEDKDGDKIYLHSMGSGANWLYSHLTLFLALHQYFIEINQYDSNDLFSFDRCLIPSILMLDQPTQVYFPNLDNKQRFDASDSDDIKAVENIFEQIAIYCDKLKNKFGYAPQIIITDHADNLNLGEQYQFEDFVVARWRNRGFIKEIN